MRFILFSISFLLYNICNSQVTKEVSPPENIKTIILQEIASERQMPIIELGKTLQFTFDDINGDEADYYYKIKRYNFDWTLSQLLKSEYLRGMDDQHLQDYKNSYNTLQIYSHYTLNIPNEDVRIIKTGNYILEIYNDDDELFFSKNSLYIEIKQMLA